MERQSLQFHLLGSNQTSNYKDKSWRSKALCFFLCFFTISIVGLIIGGNLTTWVLRGENNFNERIRVNDAEIVESEQGVVAADDGRCSEIGASMLRQGGHAVDSSVATALCVGVVNPMASGIGGGAFMIVRSSSTSKTQAFDMRETAPLAASKVLNIFDSYGTSVAAKGNLGVHRLIEALKHMFAVRMNLGDPKFVDIKKYVSEMLSPSYAKQIRTMIVDDTTFPPEYYMNRWSQLRDHGTSHFCIVDAERNAVSMTTTINYGFGAGMLSPSTGIVLNDEMGDFSAPTEITPDTLPPAPANFIEANKRPLSSMTPIVVTKNDQLVGVLGGSGGMDIIPAVVQVFINHFILGMEPLTAVQSPRVYHKLMPNIVKYENWTVIDGDHIEIAEETKLFLTEKGHKLEGKAAGAMVQLVVQSLQKPVEMGRKNGRDSNNGQIFHGTLTAVSDPRKDGRPAAV
ncbi:glutathione hydrolase 3 isoform X2 [Hevea brasiliensis]|uniref:glutathione hydrolase 3 isoform X2 n=1 Tax=Hevea brasiliensis TaxID=3981 RepID=UPI0025EFF71D|nr:glutathione hydrolase 3 isoform X2 [Hevea brasiliensis]